MRKSWLRRLVQLGNVVGGVIDILGDGAGFLSPLQEGAVEACSSSVSALDVNDSVSIGGRGVDVEVNVVLDTGSSEFILFVEDSVAYVSVTTAWVLWHRLEGSRIYIVRRLVGVRVEDQEETTTSESDVHEGRFGELASALGSRESGVARTKLRKTICVGSLLVFTCIDPRLADARASRLTERVVGVLEVAVSVSSSHTSASLFP